MEINNLFLYSLNYNAPDEENKKSIFIKLYEDANINQIDKEKNRLKYLKNELEKEELGFLHKQAQISKSQTKLELKKNYKTLYQKVSYLVIF